MKTYLEVSAIENGTVVDHIPADSLFKVLSILGLESMSNRITFGTNLESKRIGTKAIIKISDMFVKEDYINKIAIFAPDARISYIQDFNVVEKVKVALPETFDGNIRCANPMCVTNKENVSTKFHLADKNSVSYRCHYCEKITIRSQFEIIK